MTVDRDYVAVCPECGSAVAWLSVARATLDKSHLKTTVQQWIEWGLNVVRMTTEDASKALSPHHSDCTIKAVAEARHAD